MARSTMRLDFQGFNELVTKFEGMGGDVKRVVADALEDIGQKIGRDTEKAVQKGNLPAKGKFSHGDTKESIVQNPKATSLGSYMITIGVGFDFEKTGAGGYLIKGYYQKFHGTPRHMDRVEALYRMYEGKKYMKELQTRMQDDVAKEIIKLSEGK